MQQHPLGHPTLKKVYYLPDKEKKDQIKACFKTRYKTGFKIV